MLEHSRERRAVLAEHIVEVRNGELEIIIFRIG